MEETGLKEGFFAGLFFGLWAVFYGQKKRSESFFLAAIVGSAAQLSLSLAALSLLT